MKKSDLWTGLGMIALGVLFLLAALLWETPLESIFYGMFGAFAAPGTAQVCKYIKWSSPKNAPLYQERLEQEQIDLRDERKRMLRDRSGRIAYVLGLLFAAVSITAFSFLGKLGVVDEAASRLLIWFLAGDMLFLLLAGIVAYKLLERKY